MSNIDPKHIDINDERSVRLQKLHILQEKGINPYPAKVERTHALQEVLSSEDGTEVTVAGRLMTKRTFGKLTFGTLKDESATMQVAFKQDEVGEEAYSLFSDTIDIGDILQITGTRFVTHKGEPTILVKTWKILAKALLPLPDKYHGLQDEETRYRKRYLDFLVNDEEKEKIEVRAHVLRAMRDFLEKQGFLEVETPILETVASGTMAKPFETYLNAFSLPVYLRIAGGELWLKRLMVGGFEKVFDMGRVFRNEGVDYSHNPEFTMLEYYWAYADYKDNMKLHEELIPYVVKEAVGTLKIQYNDQEIDFTPPYAVVTFRNVVKEHTGIDIQEYQTADELRAVMREKGYEAETNAERGKLLDGLYKQGARPKLIQPTFVLEYPVELKPLAKRAENPQYTEMFQLLVNGYELSNSYTELNDPIDQRERFEEQARIKAGGEEEDVMIPDDDFVVAMEHGMPPSTGTGIGIDRFVALITDSHTVREVTAFPIVKPIDTDQE